MMRLDLRNNGNPLKHKHSSLTPQDFGRLLFSPAVEPVDRGEGDIFSAKMMIKQQPGVSKGCCLEVFKYLRVSKKHSFVTPGTWIDPSMISCPSPAELVVPA